MRSVIGPRLRLRSGPKRPAMMHALEQYLAVAFSVVHVLPHARQVRVWSVRLCLRPDACRRLWNALLEHERPQYLTPLRVVVIGSPHSSHVFTSCPHGMRNPRTMRSAGDS